MRWKQFFTPVRSLRPEEAQKLLEDSVEGAPTILDVRQHNEYEAGHIPGAQLIPLPELNNRIDELDPSEPTVVYCAIGGRSRVAAQMLAGKNFEKVYNLTGGFKAWQGKAAIGDELQGLELFTGEESPERTLAVAYSLEAGLRDFYLSMAAKVNSSEAQELFGKLAQIEVKHQERLFEQYIALSGTSQTRLEFEKENVARAMEGGLTTEEYVRMFHPDWESVIDIVDIAMSIEAQALDLYQRAAARSDHPEAKKALTQIGEEERTHLVELGKLIERL
ncbi:MAG: sulfurtransferase [Desulfobacterales bacterium]|nr:sulfurtransferase [Desulfobacterales bacterium]